MEKISVYTRLGALPKQSRLDNQSRTHVQMSFLSQVVLFASRKQRGSAAVREGGLYLAFAVKKPPKKQNITVPS